MSTPVVHRWESLSKALGHPKMFEVGEPVEAALIELAIERLQQPIPMVLHCPACHHQHIDAPEETPTPYAMGKRWTNPPHRSHLCAACGLIWRPADVPTTGVERIKTRGENDTW